MGSICFILDINVKRKSGADKFRKSSNDPRKLSQVKNRVLNCKKHNSQRKISSANLVSKKIGRWKKSLFLRRKNT